MRFILLGETSCISPYTILEYSHPQSTSASSMPSSLAPRFAIALQFQAGYIKNASPGKASSNSLALISCIDQLLKPCHLGHRHEKDYAADRFLTNRDYPRLGVRHGLPKDVLFGIGGWGGPGRGDATGGTGGGHVRVGCHHRTSGNSQRRQTCEQVSEWNKSVTCERRVLAKRETVHDEHKQPRVW